MHPRTSSGGGHFSRCRLDQFYTLPTWASQSLTKLTTLRLLDINWTKLSSALHEAFCSIFALNPIVDVDFLGGRFLLESLVSLFKPCRYLEVFAVRGLNISNAHIPKEKADEGVADISEQVASERKCRLRKLWILQPLPDVWTWIVNPNSVLDLTCLRTLGCYSSITLSKSLLMKLGGSLHHLTLSYPPYYRTPVLQFSLVLLLIHFD
jgi:hypothetical protein